MNKLLDKARGGAEWVGRGGAEWAGQEAGGAGWGGVGQEVRDSRGFQQRHLQEKEKSLIKVFFLFSFSSDLHPNKSLS